MKTITLRDIPEDIAREIEERAHKRRQSLNRTVIEMLSECVTDSAPRIHHDLDHLFGVWEPDEAEQVEAELAAQRNVDQEIW